MAEEIKFCENCFIHSGSHVTRNETSIIREFLLKEKEEEALFISYFNFLNLFQENAG